MFEKIDSTDSLPVRDLPPVRRRATIRYRCHLASPARLAPEATGGVKLAWVHNLSERGVGLLLQAPVDVGVLLDIDLLTAVGGHIPVCGRVAHATQRLDGSWLIGCELQQPLDPSDVEALL